MRCRRHRRKSGPSPPFPPCQGAKGFLPGLQHLLEACSNLASTWNTGHAVIIACPCGSVNDEFALGLFRYDAVVSGNPHWFRLSVVVRPCEKSFFRDGGRPRFPVCPPAPGLPFSGGVNAFAGLKVGTFPGGPLAIPPLPLLRDGPSLGLPMGSSHRGWPDQLVGRALGDTRRLEEGVGAATLRMLGTKRAPHAGTECVRQFISKRTEAKFRQRSVPGWLSSNG